MVMVSRLVSVFMSFLQCLLESVSSESVLLAQFNLQEFSAAEEVSSYVFTAVTDHWTESSVQLPITAFKDDKKLKKDKKAEKC